MKSTSAARLVSVLVLLVLLPVASPADAARKVPVHVRAVTWKGEILFDRTVRTGTAAVPTRAKAECLGGSPTNGFKKVPGATALGALYHASLAVRPRQPLLLSNAFDFGLGVCGVGDSVARGEQWWELTHNHRPSNLGGEGTSLKRGDTVLWFLSKSYNESSPDELYLKAPETVRRGRTFRVRVLAYNDKGRARPVEGARLSIPGTALSGPAGYVRLSLKKRTRIVARSSGLIPSNREAIGVRR